MDVKVDWWIGELEGGALGGWAGRWSRGCLGSRGRVRVPPKYGNTVKEERGFEPDLGSWDLGLDLTWLARVRQKVSMVLYSCMVQRSECLVLCARGRLRPCARDGLFRTARRGASAGWELGGLGARAGAGEEEGRGGWQERGRMEQD